MHRRRDNESKGVVPLFRSGTVRYPVTDTKSSIRDSQSPNHPQRWPPRIDTGGERVLDLLPPRPNIGLARATMTGPRNG